MEKIIETPFGNIYVTTELGPHNKRTVYCYADEAKKDLFARFLVEPVGVSGAYKVIDAMSFPTVWYGEPSFLSAVGHVEDLAFEKLGLRKAK